MEFDANDEDAGVDDEGGDARFRRWDNRLLRRIFLFDGTIGLANIEDDEGEASGVRLIAEKRRCDSDIDCDSCSASTDRSS